MCGTMVETVGAPAHTFAQVALARGHKWAEASIAELHKKERAQAQQIFQLQQELERAKLQLDASQREKLEFANRPRKQRSAPEAPTPADVGSIALASLPKIHNEGRPSCSRGSSDGLPSRTSSRKGQAAFPSLPSQIPRQAAAM